MDQFEMNYASKNIPVLSKESYKMLLILKIENLIQPMRWKAQYVYLTHHQNYAFRTRNYPAVVKELREFEFDLQLMMKNVALKNNFFQTKL